MRTPPVTIRPRPTAFAVLSALVLAAAGTAEAQTITAVTPAAVAPGTPMTIRGSGLAGTTHVRFHAVVGGFVGVWTQDEPVLSALDAEVTVLAPDIVAGFVFEGASVGGPFATLQTVGTGGSSPLADVYLFEGSNGFLDAAGLGTTQTTLERASASFALAGGPPSAPNPGFVATLHDAVPGALTVLGVGLAIPGLPFGDGVLAVSPTPLFALLPGSAVDAFGDAAVALPIPPVAAITVGLQWAFLDLVGHTIEISNAMHVAY